jgi:hypothetical protein
MGLMSFLKGLFGSRDTLDVEDEPLALNPAPTPARAPAPAFGTPAPAPAATPMPITPPAPPAPPQFRLAVRYPTTIDFPAVLSRAGVDAEQQQRVRKAQELLGRLPEDAPAAVKRQIVEAAFTAFDVPTQKIIAAATAEVEALEAFIEEGGAKAQRVLDDGAARIAELEAEIAEIRESMAAAVSDQGIRDAATQQQIAGVKPILTFFAQTQPTFGQVPPPSTAFPDLTGPRSEPPRSEPVLPSFAPPRASSSLPDYLTDIDVE